MIFAFTLISGIFLDLFSKYLATIYLKGETINIFSNILFFSYVENKGIAFSIEIPFLKILTIILIFSIFGYYLKEEKKKKSKIIDFSFGLILAGAIGNGIERIFNSYVIDFIGLKNFAVFNFADIFISLGALIYIFYILKNFKH